MNPSPQSTSKTKDEAIRHDPDRALWILLVGVILITIGAFSDDVVPVYLGLCISLIMAPLNKLPYVANRKKIRWSLIIVFGIGLSLVILPFIVPYLLTIFYY